MLASHRRSKNFTLATAVLLALSLTASCANGIGEASRQVIAGAPQIDSTNKPTTSKNDDQSLDNLTYTKAVQLAVVDIQAFWAESMPGAFGQEYQPIPVSKMYPYDEQHAPPQCGPEKLPYEVLRGNAFYCQFGDFIAWDDGELFPNLYSEFGPFAIAMVLAHEWGHAIQDQIGLTDENLPTIVLEQQADCFAGSWTRRLADGKSENLALGKGSLDSALGGMLKFRDEPGRVAAGDPGAHGSGFDRLRAFREGFVSGLEKCSTYSTDNLPVLEFPFDNVDEYATGGNLPLQDMLDAVLVDLNEYFGFVYPSFRPVDGVQSYAASDASSACDVDEISANRETVAAFYCPSDNKVWMNVDVVEDVNSNIGDFAVGTALALPWTAAAQIQAGTSESDLEGSEALNERLCATGGWANSYVVDRQRGGTSSIPKRGISISGGDLDEAILFIIAYTSKEASKGESLGFDHTEAFQKGVLEGAEGCSLSLG